MYRKYKPTAIFTGTEILPEGAVLITEADGTILEIIDENEAGADFIELQGLLSPGFVNAHCHIELSHMQGQIREHIGLVDFVQEVMNNRGKSDSSEKDAAMKAAAGELYHSGTVAVGDICNGPDSIRLKETSPLYWHNFIEVSGFVDASAETRLAAAEAVLLSFNESLTQFDNSLAPHAPYSVSKSLFQLLDQRTTGQITSIHNQEAAAENELYISGSGNFLSLYKNFGIDISRFSSTGQSSFSSWLPYFARGQKIIAVHNTFTSAADLELLNHNPSSNKNDEKYRQIRPELFFCLCINANLFIENCLPPIDLLISNKANIVLGTDSYASNWYLNIMEEITTIRQHFPHIPLQTILQWATLNGAKALGIDGRFGSFQKGKKPGLVLIDVEKMQSELLT